MPRSHNLVLRQPGKLVPYGIPGSNPGLGAIPISTLTDLLNLKRDYSDFREWVLRKQYSNSHEKKLLLFGKKLSFHVYFNYETLMPIQETLNNDCYYKVIRAVIRFYQEKYFDNAVVAKELNRLKLVVPEPKSQPDIYTPTAKDVVRSLEKLREINPKYAQFYLGLALSGVRIVELESVCSKTSQYKEMGCDSFNKILLNSRRHTKSAYYIYLPNDYVFPSAVSLGFFKGYS